MAAGILAGMDAIRFHRRGFLWLGAGAAAALFPPGLAHAGEVLDWGDFVARGPSLREAARAGTAPGIDAYLYTIAALAVRLTGVPDAKLFPFKPRAPLVSLAPIHRGVPLVVIEWRMEPGAVLQAHNHPGYSVCTLGLEGEAEMRHYQVAPDAPPFSSRVPFAVRKTRELVLGPRSISTLAPERDNVHTFTAGPRGARGIDIGTLHAAKDTGFSFLAIAPGEREARWDGN